MTLLHQQNIVFKESIRTKFLYFVPLISFIPAYQPLKMDYSQLDYLIYYLSFFIICALAASAASKALMKLTIIQLIIYHGESAKPWSIYLEDIDYISYDYKKIYIWSKLNNTIIDCVMRRKDVARLATFLNMHNIRSELMIDRNSAYDWLLYIQN